MRSIQHAKARGFTLVEVLVISPIVVLLIGTFVGSIIYLTGEVLAARAGNVAAYQVQDALNAIEIDVELSGAFLARNNVDIVTPQGYNNTTQVFESVPATTSGTGVKLIINALATTRDPLDRLRQPVYTNGSPNPCSSPNIQQNRVYTYNIIYFVRDNSLWRRVLMPAGYASSTTACAVPWQQASCNPTVTISETGHCRALDRRLVDNIQHSGFVINYFPSAQSTTPTTNATSTNTAARQAALNNSPTVLVTLMSTATIAGRTIEHSGSMRATRLGGLVPYAANDSP